jgi:ribonuclease HI
VYICAPDGEEIYRKKFLGEKTNNQAEYEAMLLALEELCAQKATHVLLRADSELMIKQMRGEYRVKNENIVPLYQKARQNCDSFGSVRFEHVRRELNKVADRLANEAIDERVR